MTIRLVRPTADMKEAALEYKKEHFDYGDKEINGSELLDQMDSYEEWLQSVTNNTSAKTVNPAWVVTDTFFALDESNRIVGIIDLRHTLNDFLKDYGNSGYSVRPTERRKGYATEMLCQIKSIAKEAGMTELHMATFQDNIGSVKTITKNGGVLERTFEAEGKTADMYLIRL